MSTTTTTTSSPSSQVRVGVRIRPLTSKESSEGGRPIIIVHPNNAGDHHHPTVAISNRRQFTFDSVYPETITQSDLYGDVAPSLLEAFLNGFNATVLAYGQTGSGKTYTMGSETHHPTTADTNSSSAGIDDDSNVLSDNDGLIPRFMRDIFTLLIQRQESAEKILRLRRRQSKSALATAGPIHNNNDTDDDCQQQQHGGDILINFQLSASFLEVYGEDIHDLMDDDRKCLPIREDSNGVVIVKGLQETPVTSDAEAMRILNQGTMNRTTASTLMNLTSSRSHAVFTVNLRQTTRSSEGVDVTSTSRFTFVDLAGSERMKKTGAEGERAREGIRINEGLLALGNVINALADEDRLARGEKVHVPYRQSKLTRLLQDALGGNSQTLFLACVSPSDTNASETLSTLQYANRARNIKNAPTRNVDATALELQRLRSLTNVLKCELIKQRFMEEGGGASTTRTESCIGEVDEELLKREDVASYMARIDEKVAELSGSGGASGSSNLDMSFPVHSVPPPLHPTTSRPSILPTASSSMSSGVSSNKPPTATASTRTSSRFTMENGKNQDDFDALILDVNPEEDMQLIDQLLELQHHDHKFSIEQRDDQEKLVDMEGEIVAQENRLLQLRENLKVYRSMKDKYEQLMCDVHSLESEKLALARELDQAQVDPTKGCSTAIKKKLKTVEENLARARSESRKHQQMYRQAEQEVQKCKALERKIQELKHGKVNLIKKQKDAAAKHKEFTIQKTREIHALKRKERTADKKISEMESEVHKYKSNLERSRSQCEKLSDKLKQTETHLMRLLTKRRTDISHNARSSHQSRVNSNPLQRDLEGMEQFAPVNEEMNSLKFLLEKTVADRVSFTQTKEAYTTKVIEHGELMQLLAKESKVINTWKREYNNTDPNTSVVEDVLFEIKEHEDTVQQLQLKLELVENDLDQLRSKFPSVEEDTSDEETRIGNGSALKMIAKLDGPVLRTLLWNLLDSYFSSELQRRNAKDILLRKDSTLRSFENEIMMQNEKFDALTKSLERRKKLMSSDDNESDPFEFIHSLEEEVSLANKKLEACLVEKASVMTELEKTRDALSMEEEQHAKVEEQMALLRSQQKLTESTDETAQMLRQLQEVMAAIGMSREERDTVRMKLEHCVEDACARMLDDAKTQRDRKSQQVDSLRKRLVQMHDALGVELQLPATQHSLSNELATLESKLRKIQPQFNAAVERRSRLLNDVTNLASDFGETNLSGNLRQLVQQNSTLGAKRARPHSITAQQRVSMASSREGRAKLLQNVEAMINGLETIKEETIADDMPSASELTLMKPGSLSDAFLDDCEREIKKMKHVRSDRLLSNVEKCDHVRSMTKQMHVGKNDLPPIIAYGLRKRKQGVPSWWDEGTTEMVYSALFRQGSILVNESFTDHLTLMLQTLQAISHGRQLLSSALRTVIDESHGALLATAEGCGMVNAEDLSRSLQEALQHLPPLSKEHSKACIDEMQMLNEAAEAVAQSEVETLTVLWEGLNVSSNQRGKFWGELEDSTTKLQMKTAGPFDHILRECPPEVEEWVLKSISDATKVQKLLRIRVMKLKRIQEEVERLKKKQEAKNGIMSLNSELNVLNAKLVDFEEKASDKQRLLNKKANSSSLLEEERYRKQMQAMFVSKLEALRQELTVWEENEGQIDDADMLSEVVKSMLENSHRIDAWMNEKTRLMHLRTTKTSRLRENMIAERSASTGSRPGSASTSRSKGSPSKSQSTFNQSSRQTRSTSSTSDKYSSKSYKTSPSDSSSSSNASERQSKRNKPLLSSSLNPQEQSRDVTPKKPLRVNTSSDKAPVLLPFGDLLSDTPSKEKENY
jgi:hypothetical protein